jgi:hypothetical protein
MTTTSATLAINTDGGRSNDEFPEPITRPPPLPALGLSAVREG